MIHNSEAAEEFRRLLQEQLDLFLSGADEDGRDQLEMMERVRKQAYDAMVTGDGAWGILYGVYQMITKDGYPIRTRGVALKRFVEIAKTEKFEFDEERIEKLEHLAEAHVLIDEIFILARKNITEEVGSKWARAEGH
ncbi:hypothetical protein ACFL0X_02300, partial [Nanoarchaeota archaeon]